METVSKQEIRTRETQSRLLSAAEEIFVRDGYEAAQLDAIAALAGRSKGAVYTHFRSKEDLFLALFEQRTRSFVSRLIASLEKCTSRKQSLEAFREFIVGLAQDRVWPILTLEFKLFAIRHPEAHARLRTRQQKLRCCGGDILQRVMKDLGRSLPLSCTGAATGLGALSNALLLEHLVDSKTLSDEDTRHLLGMFFDAVIQGKTAGKAAR